MTATAVRIREGGRGSSRRKGEPPLTQREGDAHKARPSMGWTAENGSQRRGE